MAVVKVIEVMSSSKVSWEDATKQAIERASKSLKNIRSAWVQDQSVTIEKGKVKEYRITLKLSFELQ
ncbi:MAG: dodecin family protein [Saprospiraceae bacterium]|jgi:hypothetical protein|nr:dodecin domain-containing protein [Saprospiraceae bacterium]MBK7465657.1 dodecin domain-containing protein [Saprospiraceae bacterium]MBK9993918.1 dodecin domain-containing protein [Saprospiraceae bacterium]